MSEVKPVQVKLESKKIITINTIVVDFFIIVVLWIWLTIASPYFFTDHNLRIILIQLAIIGVLAVGQLFVIITGGIDLSVGTVAQLSNIVLALLLLSGMSIPLAIIISLSVGIGFGLINGALIHELGMPPFITTLGTMIVADGVSLLLSKGTNLAGLPISLANFGRGLFLGIPNLFWFFAIALTIGEIILRFSRLGKYIYAIGSNVEAVRLSGINIRRVVCSVYMISGFLASVGGIMLTLRLWMGIPTCGANLNLYSIAAAALGGASLFGAQGNAIGVLFGTLIMATISNGSVLLNISPFWQQVILGILVILTVALDQIRTRAKYTFVRKF
jgi:ribose transport system permease protein